MERDDEVKGSGNSYDFGARLYDSRLGRWLKLDKHFDDYPTHTPYGFAINSPTMAIDPDGNKIVIIGDEAYRKAMIQAFNEMAKTEEGARMLRFMLESKSTFVFLYDPNTPKAKATGTDRQYYGYTVDKKGNKTHYINYNIFDPKLDEEATKENVSVERRRAAGLGHEVKHPINEEMGIADDRSITEKGKEYTYDYSEFPPAATAKSISADELSAVHSENLIRASLGLSLRIEYEGIVVVDMVVSEETTPTGTYYVESSKEKFDYSKTSVANEDRARNIQKQVRIKTNKKDFRGSYFNEKKGKFYKEGLNDKALLNQKQQNYEYFIPKTGGN